MDFWNYDNILENSLSSMTEEEIEVFEQAFERKKMDTIKFSLILLLFFPLTPFIGSITKTGIHMALAIIHLFSIVLLCITFIFAANELMYDAWIAIFVIYMYYLIGVQVYICVNISKIRKRSEKDLKLNILRNMKGNVL